MIDKTFTKVCIYGAGAIGGWIGLRLAGAGCRVSVVARGATLDALKRGQALTILVGEKHVPKGAFGQTAEGDGSLYNGRHPASFSRVAGPGFSLADSMDAPFNKNFGSSHNGVCNFLMADGSFRAMSNNTADFVLGEMSRRGN